MIHLEHHTRPLLERIRVGGLDPSPLITHTVALDRTCGG